MSMNPKETSCEKLQFEDLVRFTGISICASHEDELKEAAASLILSKIDSKSKLSSHLKCYETYITFYPEITVNSIKIEGRISLETINGFFVSLKHPKSFVLLFQNLQINSLTLYGMVLSSSSKAQKLTRLLGVLSPQQNVVKGPASTKMKSVTIGPKNHNSSNGYSKDIGDVSRTRELVNGLPPPGTRFRSEFTWNKNLEQQNKVNYSPSSQAVHTNGHLLHGNHQLKLDKLRNEQFKSSHPKGNDVRIHNKRFQNGPNRIIYNNVSPSRANNHVSFRQPTLHDFTSSGNNDHTFRRGTVSQFDTERETEGSGYDTPFPYDPNENIEEFSIGYYNTEDDFNTYDRAVLQINDDGEMDKNDPLENPWVENITYISSSKNGGVSVTSNGPVYLYVAQQVNPRFEMQQ
ncbi:hypothetical protein MN116_005952 [Schistosoma mekongi]|uniref:Trematode PH-like domain-containing protein n=1 Tax=Schistosoma mekongi TaxID=38744 RepID=A0AAE2D414_SCHME|nr:hypothetical protein MN116_005952 [Schistosoma mekongi]